MEKTLANLIVFLLFIVFAVLFIRETVPESWHWLAIILFSILWLQFVKE